MIIGLIILLLAISTYLFFNSVAKTLKRRHVTFYEKYDIPSDFKGVFVSDLHIAKCPIDPGKIAYEIGLEGPDFVIFTGDFANSDDEKTVQSVLNFVEKLVDYAACPVYITYGNHDHKDIFCKDNPEKQADFTAKLKNISPRIYVLENSYEIYEKNGKKLLLGGLTDVYSNKSNVVNVVEGFKETAANESARLGIITHNPDMLLKLDENFGDFLLAGHTHGGQISMPFNMEFTLLRTKDKMAKKGVFYGKHLVKNVPVYITSGLGCSIAPVRFGTYPEIVTIEIWNK